MVDLFAKIFAGAAYVAFAALLFLLIGLMYAFPVMWIWNWMMPELFALPTLTFMQAFWGTFLCRLLFANGNTKS